ncbi:metallophosphoesterase family protein [Methanocella arvoryzae]|uniref:Phosphoesterase n=1 Tax=Methanocella arvoryzae (strain DSM 22066 / NBRC 105507 / MRE50) TaxID=351160 RepID=Q0W1F2_METAR|nr:metallophosphoesterase family protein [Methanocella arvoryzae]CAJ37791.1 putative metallophosphoesterase [Methanocella arvoryzae MRE50]
MEMKIGLISDIHANVVALQAVLDDMKDVDVILCAGDIVGYNPYPNETVELLKKYRVKCVKGNYDNAVVTGDTQWFNPVAIQTVRWTTENITRDNLRFLETLPDHIDLNGITIYHGSPSRLEEFIFENDHERFCQVFDPYDVQVVVFGHTHVPLKKVCGSKIILNPGSVGQPRDGDPRASYGIWDTEKQEFTVRRVSYDYTKVQEKIKEAGLPQMMADRLKYGK